MSAKQPPLHSPPLELYSPTRFALGVMVTLAVLMAIRDNRKALIAVHVLMAGGTALIAGSTMAWQSGVIGPATWMIAVGLGLYMGYVPYGCVLFDRLFAAVGAVGTAGFLIYVTDAFGYLGSVTLLLYKDLAQPDLSWLDFFIAFSWLTSGVCTLLFLVSAVYFWRETRAGRHSSQDLTVMG